MSAMRRESGQRRDSKNPDAGLEKPVALHKEGADEEGIGAAFDYSGAAKTQSPRERALVRKLDRWIMPTLWAMYWLNYLDRNAIALARLDGIEDDLGLSGTQYQTCVAILNVGYILGQVPSNMLLTRLKPSQYMSGFMALWAVVSACSALSQNFIGLLLTRFFLGIAEAPFYPGALYIIGSFYVRKEVALRISILYTGNVLATAFAGLIALGIFKMSGVAGLAGWRWLFILEGIVTFIIAAISFFTLPNHPLDTRWLNPEERQLAHDRVNLDTVDLNEKSTVMKGLKEAVRDPRLYVFAFMQHMHLAANGFKNFFPTIVQTLGFDRTITLVLTCPPYLIAGFCAIAYSWSSGHFNERTWHITVSKTVAILGFILACATLNTGARYFAMCVFAIGTYCVNSIILGWVASTCGQTREKKAVSLALVNSIANLGFVWTAYLWPEWDAPRYVIPMSGSAACSFATLAGAWLMRWLLVRENRKIRVGNDEARLFYAY